MASFYYFNAFMIDFDLSLELGAIIVHLIYYTEVKYVNLILKEASKVKRIIISISIYLYQWVFYLLWHASSVWSYAANMVCVKVEESYKKDAYHKA